jgi:hypothetical protein
MEKGPTLRYYNTVHCVYLHSVVDIFYLNVLGPGSFLNASLSLNVVSRKSVFKKRQRNGEIQTNLLILLLR